MVQQLRCVFVCRYFCKMHSWRPKLLWCTVPLLPDWFDWTQIRRKNFSVNNLIVSFLFSPSQIRLIDRMFDRLCHRLFHSRFPHRLFHSGFLKMYVIRAMQMKFIKCNLIFYSADSQLWDHHIWHIMNQRPPESRSANSESEHSADYSVEHPGEQIREIMVCK